MSEILSSKPFSNGADSSHKKKKKKNKNKSKSPHHSPSPTRPEAQKPPSEDPWVSDEEEPPIVKKMKMDPMDKPQHSNGSSSPVKPEGKVKEVSPSDPEDDFDVNATIQKLLAVQNQLPGTLVQLKLATIQTIIRKALATVQSQPMLLQLEAPLTVGSDIHGQYFDLLRFMNNADIPPKTNYLFLGDYVDRGKQSIETLCLLLAFKIKYPNKVFLLRGNHECQNINKIYGFWDECKRRYNARLWKQFINLFNHLPVAAVVGNRVLCMHGGLSPDLKNLNQIAKLNRPSEVPDAGILCDLLWSDPAADNSPFTLNVVPKRWGENDRGVSYVFGEKVVKDFQEKHDLDLIVRGHQVMENGYEFFAGQKLVTIFSAPNYCNEFDNDGAMLRIGENLCCSFYKMTPAEKALKEKKGGWPWRKPGTPIKRR